MMKPLLQFSINDCRVSVFNLGFLALDGGAMFGVVPRTLWSRLAPPDELNRINLATNCLLIETGDEKIMVDTGCGTKFGAKHREIYGIRDEAGKAFPESPASGEATAAPQGAFPETPVDRALAAVGLKTGDITRVLFTHLHFDHAGGATRLLADGRVVPAFENARYMVHEGEWRYGSCPHERCKASYLQENLAPLRESGRLTLLSGECNEIVPGLWQIVSGGHTPSHQIVVFDPANPGLAPLPSAAGSGGTAGVGFSRAADGADSRKDARNENETSDRQPFPGFIYWGDLIPTRHHLKIPYVMGYDEYPVETMAAKRLWLKRAFESNWLSLFEHDPDMPACRLQPTGKPDDYAPLPIDRQ